MNEFEPRPERLASDAMQPEGQITRLTTGGSGGLMTGAGLGKYRILERIRTYHNAVVYKARDTMLDRLVALKQMLPELMDHPTACGNFKKEAQLLARVPKDSRNVLNVHELIEDEKGLFIVEEYIPGDWLESLIAKRLTGVADAWRLLRSACIGLRDLHMQKIVHRDINPGNIIVTRGAQARIANFYSAAQEGDMSTPPVITPKYAAPELLLEKSYDDRLDIYSLGMVIYEVCLGRTMMDKVFDDIVSSPLPVDGWTRWHTDLTQSLPDLSKLNPTVPAGLASTIRQMTAKRLDERYSCVEEVLAALTRHMRSVEIAAAPQAAPLPYSPPRIQQVLPAPPTERLFSNTPRLPLQTATHVVRPVAQFAVNNRRPADLQASRTELLFGSHGDPRRVPKIVPPSMPKLLPAPIAPPPSPKAIRRHRSVILTRATAAILLLAVGAGGSIALNRYLAYTPAHPIDGLWDRALVAYDEDKLDDARSLFQEVSRQQVRHSQHQLKRAQAERWLLMVDAKAALAKDDFDKAQRLLRDVERRGDVSPSKRNELQQKIWSKQDAYRVAANGFDDIKSGNFQAAELKLDDYEKNAAVAGLDPNALKDKLTTSRKEREYAEWLKNAETAFANREYDKAMNACNRAEDYMTTTDTRDLRKRLTDARKQTDEIARGDKAMLIEEYNEALSAYEEAGRLGASHEIEVKMRAAKAHVFYNDALNAMARGDLLIAEDKLKSSIWYSPLYEAQAKLDKMRPEFDAARTVRAGDAAMDKQDYARATSLYEDAIRRLPEPASSDARKKIREVQRRQLVTQGEKAFQHEDWMDAINALEEAQKLGFDANVADLLIRAKAKLP